MSLPCKSFFLVVQQFNPDPIPPLFDPLCVYKHSCNGILQDSGLNVSVTYERAGAPFPMGTVFFLEGSLTMFGGTSMIFADTVEDLKCPRSTFNILIPFSPRLWFEGVIANGQVFNETDGTRSLVMDVFVDGPLEATVRCRFLTSRHLLSALPVLYKKHKVTIVGDICGWSEHDLLDVDIININWSRYSKHASCCEIIWSPDNVQGLSNEATFIGVAASNPLVLRKDPHVSKSATVGAMNVANWDTRSNARYSTDPLSRVCAGAVLSPSKGLPYEIYGWQPPRSEDRAMCMDMEWPKMYKPQYLS